MRALQFTIFLLFLLSPALQVSAAESIENFEAQLLISRDGTVRVEEIIHYQFGDNQRHGIFRKIPWHYKMNGHNYNLDIDVTSVTGSEGREYNFQVNTKGDYLDIRIGDPDKFVTGLHIYKIEYYVSRAVIFGENKDIFYWNITGNEWKVPLLNSRGRIYINASSTEGITTECFAGSYGSKSGNCDIKKTEQGFLVSSLKELRGGDGLTVRVELPRGIVKEPSVVSKVFYLVRDNKVYSLPFLTIVLMGIVWNYRGRDPMRGRPVAVRYSPPDEMTPAEAGVLYDERADIIDLTSTIIDLAVRGFIRIEEIETTKFLFLTDRDYRLVRLEKQAPGELKDFELKTLNGLFEGGKKEVLVSDLKNRFYKNLDGIRKSLYGTMVKSRYFLSSPERLRRIYNIAGFLIIASGFIFFRDFTSILMMGISGGIVMVFSRFMPRKTKRGAETGHHLSGFREFIERAEKDRIKRLSSEDPTLFERMLPFALVFGLEEKWAEAFSDVFTEPPDWYVSSGYGRGFNSHIFVNDLGRGIGVINKSLYSSPKNSSGGRSISMSGGGFSGGGFGGGGGGSW